MSKLLTLYKSKLTLYKQLALVSRQFSSVTISKNTSDLNSITWVRSLLEQRGEIMVKVDEIDQQIVSYEGSNDIQDEHDTLKIKAEILAVAQEIQGLNERLTSILEREMGILREATHKEQVGNQSSRAYMHTPTQGEGFFIDKKR